MSWEILLWLYSMLWGVCLGEFCAEFIRRRHRIRRGTAFSAARTGSHFFLVSLLSSFYWPVVWFGSKELVDKISKPIAKFSAWLILR